MPSLEITALEHPEHSIAERPAAQAVDERVVGIGRPVLEDRGLPEVLQKLREHRGGRPPPGPAALPPLEQVEHLASFHSNITLPIWCLLEDPLSDSVSELPCSG